MREFLINFDSTIEHIERLFNSTFAPKGASKISDHTITHTYLSNGKKSIDVKETQDNIFTDFDPDFPELAPYSCYERQVGPNDDYVQTSIFNPAIKKYEDMGFKKDLKATIHQIGITTPKDQDKQSQLVFFREFDIEVAGEHLQMLTATFGEEKFHRIPDEQNTSTKLNEVLSKLSTAVKVKPLTFETNDLYSVVDVLHFYYSPTRIR